MKIYLVGGRGRLGKAIAAEYVNEKIILLDRAIYEDWSQTDSLDKISQYFDKCSSEEAILFVASGLLDPKLPQGDLEKVNFHLPKNLIDGAAKLGVKVVTFGTIMEELLPLKNPYIQTKTALGEYVRSVASDSNPALHLQIHTLYGAGYPTPFMFLGQILASIQNNIPFEMTSGQQLREYHHLADETKAIRLIAETTCSGVLNITHGKPVSLKAVAERIFKALGKGELLHIGALAEPLAENYEKIFELVPMLQEVEFRETLPGIVQYMQECYSGSPTDYMNGISA